MSSQLPQSQNATPPANFVVGPGGSAPFVDRRSGGSDRSGGGERRQFGSSHSGLSAEGRELAQAIDRYKVTHHRRYITCDEMLSVLRDLGYHRG